jgi:hypothetical protein
MLWVISPRRGVGRPARKLEESDYRTISVREKRITTVTAIPVLWVTVCPNWMAVLKRRASSLFSRRGIGTEVASNDLQPDGWRFGRRCAESARPIAASMRPVELGISERPHYRDIAAITAKGAPIYGVDINVLQFVVIGWSGLPPGREKAGRRGPNLDLWGMSADVLETLPGYGMAFCPTFPGFGTSERVCRWQQAFLAAAAEATIARSSPVPHSWHSINWQIWMKKYLLVSIYAKPRPLWLRHMRSWREEICGDTRKGIIQRSFNAILNACYRGTMSVKRFSFYSRGGAGIRDDISG